MTVTRSLLIAAALLVGTAPLPVDGVAQSELVTTIILQEATEPIEETVGVPGESAEPLQEPEEAVGVPGESAVPAQEPAEGGLPASPAFTPQEVVRIGQSYTVPEGAVTRELVVIMGHAEILGTVERDVVVVLGSVDLGPDARIGGDLVTVAVNARLSSGAVVEGDLVVVAGDLDAPATFVAGGESVVIGGFGGITSWIGGVVPWFSRGLLWGRPIVPDLAWVWAFMGALLLAYVALGYLFDRPIRASTGVLVERPIGASLVGLLVLVLMGPVSFLLAISVIGLAVIPFAMIALFAAAVLGRIAVFRWIGAEIVPEGPDPSRWLGVRSLVIGVLVATVTYMIPVLGIVTWTLIGVFGLGAITLALADGLKHETPPSPPRDPGFPPDSLPPNRPAKDVSEGPPTPENRYASEAPGPPPSDGHEESTPLYEKPLESAEVASQSELLAFPRAGFLVRTGAFILDVLLVAIVGSILGLTDRSGSLILLLLAYHIGFWVWKSTTIGGIICHLRIVRADGSRMRFVDGLVRGLSSIFSLVVVGLGALWILKDEERQSWHDKIAGTYVVKVPGNHPL